MLRKHVAKVAGAALGLAIALGGAAQAGEPASNWSGFYLGVHGGGAWTKWSSPGSSTTLSGKGGEIGGHAGYNIQMQGVVLGVEGDISALSNKYSASIAPGVTATLGNSPLASLRARLGFLAMPSMLVYATAGVARANENFTVNVLTGSATGAATGFVGGAGLEYKLSQAFSMRVEGLHYAFRETELKFQGVTIGKVKDDTNVLRVGVSYHFN